MGLGPLTQQRHCCWVFCAYKNPSASTAAVSLILPLYSFSPFSTCLFSLASPQAPGSVCSADCLYIPTEKPAINESQSKMQTAVLNILIEGKPTIGKVACTLVPTREFRLAICDARSLFFSSFSFSASDELPLSELLEVDTLLILPTLAFLGRW